MNPASVRLHIQARNIDEIARVSRHEPLTGSQSNRGNQQVHVSDRAARARDVGLDPSELIGFGRSEFKHDEGREKLLNAVALIRS